MYIYMYVRVCVYIFWWKLQKVREIRKPCMFSVV